MPTAKPRPRPNRVRAFRPKVATGCRTCKLRRIKCDEAKPSCKKCSTTGRKCEGYFYSASTPPSHTPPPSQNSSSPDTITALSPFEMSRLSQSRSHSPLSIMQTVNQLSTDRERRCFKFFQDHTVNQLDGFFNSPFWQQMSQLLMQTAYHEPAVRHAAVALGALHEGFELGYQPNLGVAKEEAFAVEQYVKALGYLVEPIQKRGKQAADVALVTCILFVCFEILRGFYGSALSHMEAGVKIVSDIKKASRSPNSDPSSTSSSPFAVSTTPYVPQSVLNLMFIRFDAQASGIMDRRLRELSSFEFDLPAYGYTYDIPIWFDDLEGPRNSLENLRTHGIRNLDDAINRGASHPEIRMVLDSNNSFSQVKLKQWDNALEAYLDRNPQVAHEPGYHVLMMQRLLQGIHCGIDNIRATSDESLWDEYVPEFREIVEHCAAAIHSPLAAKRKLAMFTLDIGPTVGLYFVAAKCRESRTRRRAVDLLFATNRQEGVWNSLVAGRALQRVVDMEEEGLGKVVIAADVPIENRIAGVSVKFDPSNRRALLRWARKDKGASISMDLEVLNWEEEWLEW